MYSPALLKARKDDILESRFKGISIVVKNNHVTGLPKSSSFPKKAKLVRISKVHTNMSRLELWFGQMMYFLDQSIFCSNLNLKKNPDRAVIESAST
jgi:hypothetical protein